jgi:hypothetical protein
MGFRFRKTKKAGPFRLSLTKRGIGWSIGNKYIGYSHGASGRNSLRASIPGTGISYFANLGRKSHKVVRKSSDRTINSRNTPTAQAVKRDNTPTLQEAKPMPKKRGIFKKIILGAVGLYFGSAAVIGLFQGITGTGAEPETEITLEATVETETIPGRSFSGTFAEPGKEELIELPTAEETEPPETETEPPSAVDSILAGLTAAITDLTETKPETTPDKSIPETTPPEPETKKETAPPETKAPETKPPETKKPETKAPETQPPETKAPETEPPKKTITITHKDSSLSPEMVEALEGVAAFWAPTGTKIHLNPFCSRLQEVVYAGTVEDANSVKDGGWCGVCSKYANENSKTNKNATPEVIADCYSLEDYLNQIPAEFFDD